MRTAIKESYFVQIVCNALQILHLIKKCPLEATVVIMAAAALARILLTCKETTLGSLKQLDILSVLSRAIKIQQHSPAQVSQIYVIGPISCSHSSTSI